MMKRAVALLLCLATFCSLIPVSVFAAEDYVEVEAMDASTYAGLAAEVAAEEKAAVEEVVEEDIAAEPEFNAKGSVDLSAYPALANFGTQNVGVGDNLYYEKESNDYYNYSNIIRHDYTVYGTLYSRDYRDWYTFYLDKPSKVTFVAVADVSTMTLRIYNSNLTLIGSDLSGSYNDGDYTYGLVSNDYLSAGRYYVKLEDTTYNNDYLFYISIQPKATKPGKPVVEAANVSSSGKIKLTWEKTKYASKYQIYRATSKSGTYKLLATTTKTSYTDKSASAGKTYYYKVRAVSSSGEKSSFSAIVKRACKLARPDVTISNSSNGFPRLRWDKVSGAEKYYIYRATSKSGEYTKIASVKKTKFTYTDSKVKVGKTYYYKVKAIKTNGNSANSLIESIKAR